MAQGMSKTREFEGVTYRNIVTLYGISSFTNEVFILNVIRQIFGRDLSPYLFINGSEKVGFDQVVLKLAQRGDFKLELFPARFKEHGRAGRIRRNQGMAFASTAVVVFEDDEDKGCKHMAFQAIKRGIPLYRYDINTSRITHERNKNPTLTHEADCYARLTARHPLRINEQNWPRCSVTGQRLPFILSENYRDLPPPKDRGDWHKVPLDI